MSDGSISNPEAFASTVSSEQATQQPETKPPKPDWRSRILGLFKIGSNGAVNQTGEIQGTLPPTQAEVHAHNTGIASEALTKGISLKPDEHGRLQEDPKTVYLEDPYITSQNTTKNN